MPDVITVRVQAGVIHRELSAQESVNAALHELLFAGQVEMVVILDYDYRIRVLDQKILDVSCLTLLF